jgi:hypothetical protein
MYIQLKYLWMLYPTTTANDSYPLKRLFCLYITLFYLLNIDYNHYIYMGLRPARVAQPL